MNTDAKIFVAGHAGLAGSAITRALAAAGYRNLVLRTSAQLDLRDQSSTADFFKSERPDYVFLAAAKVGGIGANSRYPAEFIYDNLAIQTNVIHQAYLRGVKKLLFLGSSCIYPKYSEQPISESALLTGMLEPTNEAYAVAKIAGIKMCESYNRQYGTSFLPVMPTNLYGPGDNFDIENSHVLPALIRNFHDAKVSGAASVTVWGSGNPRREFLYSDDLAAACLFVMNGTDADLINVGCGADITIHDLALMIKEIVEFSGAVDFDTSRPDGTPRKVLDVSKLKQLGWEPKVGLREGIVKTYAWFWENEKNLTR